MLKNYLKIFLKVAGQNKLYTVLALFGISITIMFVMIVMMTFDSVVNGSGPEKNSGDILYSWRMMYRSTVEGENSMASSFISSELFEEHLSKVKEAEMVGLVSKGSWEFIFKGNRYQKNRMMTDANFWKMYDFNFIEGKPYLSSDVENQANYCVINESLKELFFDPGEESLGKTIKYQGTDFIVVGIIEDIPVSATNCNADLFIPYNVIPERYRDPYLGSYTALFKAQTKRQKAKIVKEVQDIISKLDAADDSKALFISLPVPQIEKLAMGYDQPDEASASTSRILFFFTKILAFLLLPAINLMALNYSRIRERSEEIGVRKSFGAGRKRIRNQFVFENIFMTLIGGIIGIILAYLIVVFFGSTIRIPVSEFESIPIEFILNIRVLLFALISCLVFSLVSGVLPAITMSKMKPAEILKGGEL